MTELCRRTADRISRWVELRVLPRSRPQSRRSQLRNRCPGAVIYPLFSFSGLHFLQSHFPISVSWYIFSPVTTAGLFLMDVKLITPKQNERKVARRHHWLSSITSISNINLSIHSYLNWWNWLQNCSFPQGFSRALCVCLSSTYNIISAFPKS